MNKAKLGVLEGENTKQFDEKIIQASIALKTSLVGKLFLHKTTKRKKN